MGNKTMEFRGTQNYLVDTKQQAMVDFAGLIFLPGFKQQQW